LNLLPTTDWPGYKTDTEITVLKKVRKKYWYPTLKILAV
jgi:hypothetical protein